jgi:hypothetical protein
MFTWLQPYYKIHLEYINCILLNLCFENENSTVIFRKKHDFSVFGVPGFTKSNKTHLSRDRTQLKKM